MTFRFPHIVFHVILYLRAGASDMVYYMGAWAKGFLSIIHCQ